MEFNLQMADSQVRWRKRNLRNQESGYQNGYKRPWILPRDRWKDGLWLGIQDSLPSYLESEKIRRHTGSHNLKSSWIACANLFFPFSEDMKLLAGFLKEHIHPDIQSVTGVELEYAAKPPLDPATLLREPESGRRGAHQTSPDVAFSIQTVNGTGIVLVENKLTEHSFYACSGRKSRVRNPDPKRCLDLKLILNDIDNNCYQRHWAHGRLTSRRYWRWIEFSRTGREKFKRCPAATAGYQLFRQQALAEALANEGRFDLVVSCVAYDERNTTLERSLRTTGLPSFVEWGQMFEGKAIFRAFTHQQWVSWVTEHGNKSKWQPWIQYIRERYEYI